MSYTDADLQNLSRSDIKLVRDVAAAYYVERDSLRARLAEVDKEKVEYIEKYLAWRKNAELSAKSWAKGEKLRDVAGKSLDYWHDRAVAGEQVVTAVRELMHDRTTRKDFSFVLVGKVGDALVVYDKSVKKETTT